MVRLALLFCICAAPAVAGDTLTILHTNDLHSRLLPISKYDSTCGEKDIAENACFGGVARLATAITAQRAKGPSLLLDGGDQFQGSLFYTTHKGAAAAATMAMLGYDAMTVGNHEFDDGPAVLRRFLDATEFPVLLANADLSAEPELAGVLPPTATVEVDGVTYGLIGIAPANTPELASPGPNITFADPVEALPPHVAALEEQGIDRIILLSHSGYGTDQRIAAQVAGIDVIVGGHDNSLLSDTDAGARGPYPTMVKGPDGADVAIVQAYAYGKYLGVLDVTFDSEGRITAADGEPVLMDASVAEDAEVRAEVDKLAEAFSAIIEQVVGETTGPIEGSREVCREGECQMGNLVADAMLARTKGQGIHVAIANGGGLRASIDAGPVTMGEVLEVLPFQNTLATFQLTGAELREALENGVSAAGEGSGRFPQVAGLRFTFDPAAEAGQRITSVEVKRDDGAEWGALDPDALYGIASNSFLRSGGDGYSVFAEQAQNAYDFGPSVDEVVATYLQQQSPYQPYTDGRITAE